MTNDPFEQLRVDDEPALPDPRFIARLRARLVAALELSAATDLPDRSTAREDHHHDRHHHVTHHRNHRPPRERRR